MNWKGMLQLIIPPSHGSCPFNFSKPKKYWGILFGILIELKMCVKMCEYMATVF